MHIIDQLLRAMGRYIRVILIGFCLLAFCLWQMRWELLIGFGLFVLVHIVYWFVTGDMQRAWREQHPKVPKTPQDYYRDYK